MRLKDKNTRKITRVQGNRNKFMIKNQTTDEQFEK